MKLTYFLPVGFCSGLSSPRFSAPKSSSMGAVEYEYGPEYIIYTSILRKYSRISAPVCHFAPSNRKVVEARQLADSESSYLIRYYINSIMTSLLVFVCVKEK